MCFIIRNDFLYCKRQKKSVHFHFKHEGGWFVLPTRYGCFQMKSLAINPTELLQGSKIQVKGIPDIAQHTSVTVKKCVDDDNFDYPKGLICASDHGERTNEKIIGTKNLFDCTSPLPHFTTVYNIIKVRIPARETLVDL